MTGRVLRPTAAHQAAYQDMVALIRKHEGQLAPAEILAIAANMVGKLVALQDQRIMSPDAAMDIVAKNIQQGNDEALRELLSAAGGRA